jgi:hypothetical protein
MEASLTTSFAGALEVTIFVFGAVVVVMLRSIA